MERLAATGGLIVVIGPSHAGKTSLINHLEHRIAPPVFITGVDRVLDQLGSGSQLCRWKHIPAAYELIEAQLKPGWSRGWTMLVETTLSHVPTDGPPQRHDHVLANWLRLARTAGRRAMVVQVSANPKMLESRALASSRLPIDVVAAIASLYRDPFGADLTVDATQPADHLADAVARAWETVVPS